MNETEYFRLLNQVWRESRKFGIRIHVEFDSKREDSVSALLDNIEHEIQFLVRRIVNASNPIYHTTTKDVSSHVNSK